MKRKIFSSLLALVLVVSFSLVTAVPVAAATTYNVRPFTLQTGTNAAAWSTVQKATGSYSVLLNYVSGDNSYVEFTPLTGTTVNDLTTITDGWSWWYYASAAYGPLLELRFTGGTGHVDITVNTAEASPAITTPTTEEVTNASTCIYFGNDPTDGTSFFNNTGSVTLAGVLASINAQPAMTAGGDTATAWVLTRVRAEIGWSAPGRTCYIDDIEIAGTTYYGMIQDAIDTATGGDTITVAAGTYTENVTVDESVTLTGASSATVTVISTYAMAAFTVTAANVEISGFTMTGTGIDPAVNLPLAGVYIDSVDGCNISDNVMVGESHGVYLDVGSDNNTITRNNASDNNQGFTVEPYNTTGVSASNIFTDNIANECWKYGFFVEDGSTNTFTGNTVNLNPTGFKFVGATGTGNTLNYNDITGNLNSGVTNSGTNPVVALYNWWGSATGPAITATNPGATGDSVSANVTYAPWLYLTAATTGNTVANIVANQVPAYANAVVLDTVGWNTWSVPIGLDGQYNTWAELYTLTNLPYTFAYRFDPTSQTFVSLATTSTYAIAPGEGFYVKMTAANSIPYCSSTLFTMPSRALGDGFNLIGGGMGLMEERAACISLQTAGGTAGYSHIVSPLENAAGFWIFIAGAPASVGDFVPGEGYWTFLPIDRTLGLFNPTPVPWVAVP